MKMGVLVYKLLYVFVLLYIAASRGADAFFCNVKGATPTTEGTGTTRSRATLATLHMTSVSGSANHGTATTRAGIVKTMGAAVAGTLAVKVAPCAAATRTKTELVSLASFWPVHRSLVNLTFTCLPGS